VRDAGAEHVGHPARLARDAGKHGRDEEQAEAGFFVDDGAV
jgi:hypothetical protein